MCETAASAGQIVVGTTTSEAFRRGDREPHRRKGDLPSLMGSAVVRWSERISILYSYGDPLGTQDCAVRRSCIQEAARSPSCCLSLSRPTANGFEFQCITSCSPSPRTNDTVPLSTLAGFSKHRRTCWAFRQQQPGLRITSADWITTHPFRCIRLVYYSARLSLPCWHDKNQPRLWKAKGVMIESEQTTGFGLFDSDLWQQR